ncbi:glycosyltransferase [Paenibacillus urinalis]|uniref:glycosyltransferase n=1 Tax=Paenibacillus urinalis TaxID=521520 RepID=UPI0019617A74
MNRTISLCMIVKNEEKQLKRCLESVRDKVDEIVIVDTGSTDLTLDIAREYTSKVYHYEWSNDFSAARNFSLKYATSDYILVLDADEYLSEDTNLQKEVAQGFHYYILKIHNTLSYGRAFDHTAVRLFIRDKNMYFQNRLHEHLNIIDDNHHYKGGFGIATLIYHSGYTNELLAEKEKTKRNLPLMKKEVDENPNAYNLFNMGKTYLSIEEYEKAVEYFRRAYPISGNRAYMPELIAKLAFCLGKLELYKDGIRILSNAVHLFPNETEIHSMLGRLFLDAGYFKDAEIVYRKCLEIGDQGTMVSEGAGSYLAHFSLAEMYESQNRIIECYDEVVRALQTKNTFAPALRKYFEVVSKANIPLDDVYKNIELLYNISNVNDLQILLDILYGLRHPLLGKFMSIYNINAQMHIMVVAKQYDKQYLEAMKNWRAMTNLNKENGIDILLLSIILKDEELFSLAKPLLNLNERDNKLLKKIIRCEEISAHRASSSLKSTMEQIAVSLILLEEFDTFELISNFFLAGPIDFKIKLCNIMAGYGHAEIAIDILTKLLQEQSNNIEIIESLGDICFQSNYLEDAWLLYSKILNKTNKYSTYQNCYDIAVRTSNIDLMNSIRSEMLEKFPDSAWIV